MALRVLSRPLATAEQQALTPVVRDLRAQYAADGKASKALVAVGDSAAERVDSRRRAGGVDHGGEPVLQSRRGAEQVSSKTRSACCSGGDDLAMTRRELLAQAGRGIGSVALASMLGGSTMFAAGTNGLPNLPHFRPKARRAIWLFPAGAPSQLDTWDYKPKLREHVRQGAAGIGPRQPAPDDDDRAPEGLPGRAQSLQRSPRPDRAGRG